MPSKLTDKQSINFRAATAVVVGSIIGSGIFMKPAVMAAQVGSPVWLTVVWIVAGIFSLFGALIFAEVGCMFPQTGGLYVYLRHMYGNFVAFLYGWAGFTVINTASVAAIAFVCAQYADFFFHLPRFDAAVERSVVWHIPFLGNLFPLANAGVKLMAIGLVLGLTLVNYLSVRAGSQLQLVSTLIKIVVVALLVAGIFYSGNGTTANFIHPSSHPLQGWSLTSGLIAALTGAFMSYDGWINITFLGGEIQNPQKNIFRSLVTGVFVCIVVYLLVNQAYLYVLPIDKMAASPLVASDAIAVALGETSGAIVAALIVICTFGAINGNTMAISRVTYAMGKDGLFIPFTGKEHPRFHTPGNALWLHGSWATFLIISGSFDMLADMFTFVTWAVYLLGAIGIIILRKRMPDQPRPYRVWGYPVVPWLFIAFAAFYVGSTIINDVNNYVSGRVPVINSLLGLSVTALGIPVYYYFRRKQG
ncbi:amino acid permease [Niastella caeni]|uniref:Amino acid permease n=1 Tax=Niastella caeni TaxID=2569763 RepID=A0A4S8HKN8_9BACT|nr:amino acid permease [Niastella caeni]THU35838.1 amino acid permease [Niastella caeni]